MQLANVALVVLFVASLPRGAAQPHAAPPGDREALWEAIARADSLRYVAYNSKDLEAFMRFLAEDVEVYHDAFSAMKGKAAVRTSLSHVFGRPHEVRRELVPGSLEVYPLADSAAVQLADHRFYETTPGEPERLARLAKLIVFWRFAEGRWTAFKLVSFDHRPAPSG